MKKNGILNSDISRVLSYMGHTDRICIADCGLPIPEDVERIDLALKMGVPSFMDVLTETASDMKIQKIILADEIKAQNAAQLEAIEAFFKKSGADIQIEFVPHSEFKEMTRDCKAVIRSGETTAYSNIILEAGCIF